MIRNNVYSFCSSDSIAAGCFVCLVSLESAAQSASLSRPDGKTTGAQPDGACRCHRPQRTRASRSAPVKKRNATAGTAPDEPIFILALPRSLSVEPRLHAHGKTVRHHSAGNTDTSGRLSSEQSQIQHLQIDGKVHKDKNCVDCVKGTVVPAWLLHSQKLFRRLFNSQR